MIQPKDKEQDDYKTLDQKHQEISFSPRFLRDFEQMTSVAPRLVSGSPSCKVIQYYPVLLQSDCMSCFPATGLSIAVPSSPFSIKKTNACYVALGSTWSKIVIIMNNESA